MKPIVQISLDLTTIEEALETAELAMRAGVDWLEAGTPLILAEGLHGVRKLRERFPNTPIVADLKTMDGGYLEAEMMAKAGATHVVVMERAHPETIKCVVQAGRDFNVAVMGDNLGSDCMIDGARRLEDLGCDYIVHHIGYDERRGIAYTAAGVHPTTPNRRRCVPEDVSTVPHPFAGPCRLSVEEPLGLSTRTVRLVVAGVAMLSLGPAGGSASATLATPLSCPAGAGRRASCRPKTRN